MIAASLALVRQLSASAFVRQSGLMFAATILSSVLFLVGMTILARLFPIDTLGVYYTLTAESVILAFVMLMGYNAALPVVAELDLSPLIVGMGLLALAVGTLSLPLSFWQAHWWFVLFAAFAQWPSRIIEALLVRRQKIRLVAGLRILSVFVVYGSLFLFRWLGHPDLATLFASQIVGTSLLAAIYLACLYPQENTSLSLQAAFSTLRHNFDFCRYNGPAQILSNVIFQVPLLAAAHYFSPVIAAQYNLASKFTIAPLTVFGEAVSRVYTGYLAKRHAEKTDLFANYKKLLAGLCGLGALVALGSAVFVPLVITLFFGPEWRPAITYVLVMLPLTFALIAFNPLASLFPFLGEQRFFFGLQLISFILVLASCLTGIVHDDFTLALICLSVALAGCYGLIALYIGRLQKKR